MAHSKMRTQRESIIHLATIFSAVMRPDQVTEYIRSGRLETQEEEDVEFIPDPTGEIIRSIVEGGKMPTGKGRHH